MKNISLLMLSWGSHKTLINTLESYKKNKLFDIVDEKIIFFQNISNTDVEIAENYGFDVAIGSENNIGIGLGIYSLVKESTKKYILFLENDWELICDSNITENRLQSGIDLLNEGALDVIRYRHRVNYGEPNYGAQFFGKELTAPYCLLDSLFWNKDPDIKFPEYIKKIEKNGEYFYTASSKNANFTNNPTIYIRDFYLNLVEPFITQNFEPENHIQKWWETQNFKVGHGEGLFKHNRLDR